MNSNSNLKIDFQNAQVVKLNRFVHALATCSTEELAKTVGYVVLFKSKL